MKKTISLLLVLSMLISGMTAFAALDNFKVVNMYYDGLFVDVASSAWYAPNVKAAFMYDLVKGGSGGRFNPTGNMTIAEAITLVSRIHSIYNTGKADFTQGNPWYQVYVDYAIKNGIISNGQFNDYTKAAKRTDFAIIFAKSLPAYEFNAINTITYGTIPDVNGSEYYADAVYMLYDAGILTGSDKYSSFKPDTNIQRAEVATIATRIIDKTARKTFSILPKPADPTGLSLTGATTIYVGETTQWRASVYPADANPTVTWSSGNPGVATVDQNGKITAIKAGEARITVTSESGLKEAATITVIAKTPTGLTLGGMTTISVGETVKWTATVAPAGANQWVSWTSGNPGVATVDSYGNIKGIRAGQSNITATTVNGISKTVLLTVVSNDPTGLTLAGKTTISVGETTKWTATVTPAKANQWVSWTSGNPAVATIDSYGNITAKKAGQTNITATTVNGISKTVLLTVIAGGSGSAYASYHTYYPGFYGFPNFGAILGVSPIYIYPDYDYYVYDFYDILDSCGDSWAEHIVNALEANGFYQYDYDDDDEYDVYIRYENDYGETITVNVDSYQYELHIFLYH